MSLLIEVIKFVVEPIAAMDLVVPELDQSLTRNGMEECIAVFEVYIEQLEPVVDSQLDD